MFSNLNNSKPKFNEDVFNIALVILLLVFIFIYFFKIGSYGLIDVDEPRYAEAAREMLESGDLIVPYFNYSLRFDKPIFFYWLEALSMKAFGVNEFAARLPSVLAAFLCVGVMFRCLIGFSNLTNALLSVLVLMSTIEFAALSRFSIPDMTLTAFISSTIISFFIGYSDISMSSRNYKRQLEATSIWYIFAFVFMSLGVLTKGPIAVLIPFMVLFPFFWWIRKLDYFFKNRYFWYGFSLFFILTLPWYIAVHIKTNGGFTNEFFGLHNFKRFTSVVSGHDASYFYFIPVILIGLLPWTFFLPQSIFKLFSKGLQAISGNLKDQFHWLCMWWFLFVFLFFTFSQTKLLTYVLSLFPALSILISFYLYDVVAKNEGNKTLMVSLGIFFFSILTLFFLSMYKMDLFLPRESKGLKLDIQFIILLFVLFIGVSMAWASSHRNTSLTVIILLSTMSTIYILFISLLIPKIDSFSQSLSRNFAKSFGNDVAITSYSATKPTLTFYAKRKVKKINKFDKIQELFTSNEKIAFCAKKKKLNGIEIAPEFIYGESGGYIYFTNYPIKTIPAPVEKISNTIKSIEIDDESN